MVGTSFSSSNPTVLGVQGNTGIGLLPLDDVFQVHIKNYSTGNAIGLADENLVLKPKSTYTAEWAIVPVPTANYFDILQHHFPPGFIIDVHLMPRLVVPACDGPLFRKPARSRTCVRYSFSRP